MTLEEEEKIIGRAKKNLKNFEPLYSAHYLDVVQFFSRRTSQLSDAQDLTSELFIKAMQQIHTFQPQGIRFKHWLLRMARNQFLDGVRKKKVDYVCLVFDQDLPALMEESPSEDQRPKLLEALSRLDESQMELIEMRFFEKRSFKEIGLLTDRTENNSKVSTYRALDKLKKWMS